jgi:uncharacterized protein involved in exopolysaccharide biosynthesis
MEDFSLAELSDAVRKHLLLIAIFTLGITTLACVYVFFFVPTTWESQTSIVFEENGSDPLGMLGRLSSLAPMASSGRGEFCEVLLRSRTVRRRVVDELDLVEALDVKNEQYAIETLGSLYSVNLPVSRVLELNTIWPGPTKASLRSDPGGAPEMAAALAQSLVDSLELELSETDYTQAAQQREMLEGLLDNAVTELTEAENELVKYATSEYMVNPSTQASGAVTELQTLQRREADLRAELEGAIAREATARGRLSAEERMTVNAMSEIRDPAIDKLRQTLLDLDQQITEQTEVQGKSESHPDVASLISERNSTQAQLQELLDESMRVQERNMTVNPVYSKLVEEALLNSQRVSEVQASLDVVRGERSVLLDEIQQLPAKSSTYLRLQREVDMRGEAVKRLSESYEFARLAEAGTTTNFSVMDPPVAPLRPTAPSLRKTAAVTMVASFVLAVLFAFWREGRANHRNRAAEASPADAA